MAAEALRISDYIRPLAALKLKGSIVVLDAARANPFAKSGPPLVGGLALVEPEPGLLIAFNGSCDPVGIAQTFDLRNPRWGRQRFAHAGTMSSKLMTRVRFYASASSNALHRTQELIQFDGRCTLKTEPRTGPAAAIRFVAVAAQHGIGPHRGSRESSRPHFQPNADLSAIVFREMYTGLLKSFLYFEDG